MTQFPGRDDSPVQVLFSALPIKGKNKLIMQGNNYFYKWNASCFVVLFFYCLVFDNEIINQHYTDSI